MNERNNTVQHKKQDQEVKDKRLSSFKKTFEDKWTTAALNINIEKRKEKFKNVVLTPFEDLKKYIIKTKKNYGKTRYFIEIKGIKIIFYSRYEEDETTYERMMQFLKSLVRKTTLATQLNCGNLLRASDTTSIDKSVEGPRVMTGSNGNNSEDWTIRSQVPKIKVKLKFKAT